MRLNISYCWKRIICFGDGAAKSAAYSSVAPGSSAMGASDRRDRLIEREQVDNRPPMFAPDYPCTCGERGMLCPVTVADTGRLSSTGQRPEPNIPRKCLRAAIPAFQPCELPPVHAIGGGATPAGGPFQPQPHALGSRPCLRAGGMRRWILGMRLCSVQAVVSVLCNGQYPVLRNTAASHQESQELLQIRGSPAPSRLSFPVC